MMLAMSESCVLYIRGSRWCVEWARIPVSPTLFISRTDTERVVDRQRGREREVAERVELLARPVLDAMGLELVEVFYHGGPSRGLLRMTIDKPGGIGHEDCAEVTRVIGTQLDVEEVVPAAYTLEVTSPGLDRRLRRPEEYVKYEGRLAKVKTATQVCVGRLGGMTQEQIVVRLESGEEQRIPLKDVVEARLMVEMGRSPHSHGG
jgi:ribosome maturation factor RimP